MSDSMPTTDEVEASYVLCEYGINPKLNPDEMRRYFYRWLNSQRPPARVITTAEGLGELLRRAFEDAHWLVIESNRRPWIIIEDEYGDAWAWSWLEEEETRSYRPADELPLPAKVLHEGEA